ncbi:nitrate- and nitrite sensing domain-containing protein [Xylophilus sp. GOD-11R]|uniref:nitrate- and nitrite sensing domain-containing protein n=1 Tax=Xylophilus sp. GOD-11R TaxID=3089814 RepID=UPI00298BE4F8|nr:nitrate- and nitrite sensing domain-containing protein [Xylophilus sp. GOD-11R]WPB59068.1 nitrate- and nitrite sensing domain-containing protein [Xylophilus sp. GOD-11R]
MKSGLNFLVAARQCEIRELEQLLLTSELVRRTAELIHALQKERGMSNLFLGGGEAHFGEQRIKQVVACHAAAERWRAALEQIDIEGAAIANGARLFSRIAYALQGLGALPRLRERIGERALDSAESTRSFNRLVAALLGVVFDAADSASDPELSRMLVATFHFMQGKEFTGQERAAGAAAFAQGTVELARQQHWLHLIESQERCFTVFTDFAEPVHIAAWQACLGGAAMAEIERLRRIGCTAAVGISLDRSLSRDWFDGCTERIDAMQAVEVRLAADLVRRCQEKLQQARADLDTHAALLQAAQSTSSRSTGTFFDDPAPRGDSPALGPQLGRSVLEMVQEQSYRLQAMADELADVRAALNERKIVERAKGLLMAHRHINEEEAHKMLRQTAMGQGKRLVDVAEAVLAMAELLPAKAR